MPARWLERPATPRREPPVHDNLETLRWLYSVEQKSVVPIKWLVLLFAVALLLLEDPAMFQTRGIRVLMLAYALVSLSFSVAFWGRLVSLERFRFFSYLSFASDVGFVSLLVLHTGGLDSSFYYLFFLLILRSAALFQDPLNKFWSDMFMTVFYLACAIPATQPSSEDPLTPLILRVTLLWGVILTSSFLVQVLTSQQARIFTINERLRYQSEQNREVLSCMTDAVFVFDRGQLMRHCNLAGEVLLRRVLPPALLGAREGAIREHGTSASHRQPPRLWGADQPSSEPSEGSDSFWWKLPPEQVSPAIEKLLEEVRFAVSGRVEARPITLKDQSDKQIFLVASAVSLGAATSSRMGWVILLRDLSDYQSLERQLISSERLASVGRLAAGLAHELGNPLGIIKACADYLHKKLGADSDLQEEVEDLAAEAERCRRILRELLTFASQDNLELAETDLVPLLEKALSLVSFQAPKGVEVRFDSEVESLRLVTDINLMTQALVNLLLNAIQAIDDKGTVSARLFPAAKQVTLEIEDTGRGMGQETLRHIFEPFFTTRSGGTGLGLAITERIIHRLGGSIVAESEPGKGSRFTLVLPLSIETTAPAGEIKRV